MLNEDFLKSLEVVIGNGKDLTGLNVKGNLWSWSMGIANLIESWLYRNLKWVIAAVIAALDLDDRLLAGDGPGGSDRVHRRLGAGISKPNHV